MKTLIALIMTVMLTACAANPEVADNSRVGINEARTTVYQDSNAYGAITDIKTRDANYTY